MNETPKYTLDELWTMLRHHPDTVACQLVDRQDIKQHLEDSEYDVPEDPKEYEELIDKYRGQLVFAEWDHIFDDLDHLADVFGLKLKD